MPLRSVTVNTGDGNLLRLASKVTRNPGTSANRLIEAALRAYRGEDRDQVIGGIAHRDTHALDGGGNKHARVDESLVAGIDNISRAGRVGLAMLIWDMTFDEATEWEKNRVPMGRPRKNTETA